MRAFHGKQEVKDFYLARVRAHREADQIVHGFYWEGGKGCAVGCTIHSGDHEAYEVELGIPRIIARLEDGIFEALPNGRSKLWPEQFLSAPAVGADLSLVWPRFAVWLLVDPKWGVFRFAKSAPSKKAIQDVADAYLRVIKGKSEAPDWIKLRNNADAAAAAAYAAADAAAASARFKCRNAQADKLLELLAAAPAASTQSSAPRGSARKGAKR